MSKFFKLLVISLFVVAAPIYAEPTETNWLELMPKEDQQTLENMPDVVTYDTVEDDGEPDAKGGLKQRNNLSTIIYSKNMVASLEGKQIKLGGYPVPIENNGQGLVTQFCIVPYPGAFIHVPPPPSNQMVLVDYLAGIQITDIYEPIWVIGKLYIQPVSNDLVDAVYTLKAESVRLIQKSDQ